MKACRSGFAVGLFLLLGGSACFGPPGGGPDAAEPAAPSGTPEAAPARSGAVLSGEPEAEAAGSTAAVLFVAGPDGLLRPRDVELPPLSGSQAQARALVRRVVAESGTFPSGVQVLDVFVSSRGAAVVNVTLDLLAGHSGGLAAEELTVYSLSHTLVESFPNIAEVFLIVEGQQTETLAGHLDLRRGFGRAPDRLLGPT